MATLSSVVDINPESITRLYPHSEIEYIDISDIVNETDLSTKLGEWNISTYPALVSCKIENGEIKINNTLEFDKDNPLNADDIINWMIVNDIYSGEHRVILPS